MSRFSVSSLLSHADSVAQVGRAASALQLPLASAPVTLDLFFGASWIAASTGLKRFTF